MTLKASRLGDYLLPVKSVNPLALFGEGDFAYVDISAVDREQRAIINAQRIQTSAAPSRARQEIAEGDVIVSTVRPNLNTVAMVTKLHANAIASTGFCVLRPIPEILDTRFLFHWATSDSTVTELVKLATGATYPAVSDKTIKSIAFRPPSLKEQQRVATVLDKADSLLRKRQEAIRLADEFLKALFYAMFGDPVSNTKKLPTQVIERLCQVATGATPSREREDYFGGAHPWIKTGEVDSPWITAAEEYISDAAIKETNCKIFPEKTVLVAMYGQGKTRGKVGMLGMPAATNQACAAILPSTSIDPFFLHVQLSTMYEHLRAMGRGGNQENLNLGMIKSLPVLVPPPHLVNRFLAIRQQTKSVVERARQAEIESEHLVESLASSFFS